MFLLSGSTATPKLWYAPRCFCSSNDYGTLRDVFALATAMVCSAMFLLWPRLWYAPRCLCSGQDFGMLSDILVLAKTMVCSTIFCSGKDYGMLSNFSLWQRLWYAQRFFALASRLRLVNVTHCNLPQDQIAECLKLNSTPRGKERCTQR